MRYFFVVHQLQEGEKEHSYSIVDEELSATIPLNRVQAMQEIEDRIYETEELEALRDSLL